MKEQSCSRDKKYCEGKNYEIGKCGFVFSGAGTEWDMENWDGKGHPGVKKEYAFERENKCKDITRCKCTIDGPVFGGVNE